MPTDYDRIATEYQKSKRQPWRWHVECFTLCELAGDVAGRSVLDLACGEGFYTRVLSMPLVHALKVPPGLGTGPANRGNPPFENLRHYFLDAGGDSLLAFFEMPKGAKQKGDRDAIGGMQHVSFAVSEARFNQVLERLKAEKLAFLGPIDVGCGTWSVYFYDPNGIRLEFSHQKQAEPKVVERWTQTKAEALAELRTLSQDAAWLETMVAHLPDSR